MRYVEKSDLINIADTLREFNKTSAQFSYPQGFIQALQNIQHENFQREYGVILGLDNPLDSKNYNGQFCVYDLYTNLYQFITLKLTNRDNITFLSLPISSSWSIDDLHIVTLAPNVLEVNFKTCSETKQMFADLLQLKKATMASCQIINERAFYHCYELQEISFPLVREIQANAFDNCISLSTISFPNCIKIDEQAFYHCENLQSVYLLGSSMINLININAFEGTPIINSEYLSGEYGSIYLPSILMSQYLAFEPWQLLSDRLVFI